MRVISQPGTPSLSDTNPVTGSATIVGSNVVPGAGVGTDVG